MRTKTIVIALLAFGSIGFAGWADAADASASAPASGQTQPDKSGYTLFNPTPAAQMRDFNTNRPSVTEGPLTIDAGHYQVELSFAEFTHDDDGGVQSDTWNVMPTNLRVGVLNNFEIDVMVEPYLNSLVHGKQQPSQRQNGTGETQVRASLNLWGNEGGEATAGGVLAFVSLPTSSGGFGTHHVEGGVILPLIVHLPAGFDAGAMIECDIDRNAGNNGYGVDLLHTATVGHALLPKLAGYIEYAGVSPISTGNSYLAYFDAGITYALTDNIQLDAAINIGLSRRADDFTVLAGLSFRI